MVLLLIEMSYYKYFRDNIFFVNSDSWFNLMPLTILSFFMQSPHKHYNVGWYVLVLNACTYIFLSLQCDMYYK